jgi:hypothetical protein
MANLELLEEPFMQNRDCHAPPCEIRPSIPPIIYHELSSASYEVLDLNLLGYKIGEQCEDSQWPWIELVLEKRYRVLLNNCPAGRMIIIPHVLSKKKNPHTRYCQFAPIQVAKVLVKTKH